MEIVIMDEPKTNCHKCGDAGIIQRETIMEWGESKVNYIFCDCKQGQQELHKIIHQTSLRRNHEIGHGYDYNFDIGGEG